MEECEIEFPNGDVLLVQFKNIKPPKVSQDPIKCCVSCKNAEEKKHNNAILTCRTCSRRYHQKCHKVCAILFITETGRIIRSFPLLICKSSFTARSKMLGRRMDLFEVLQRKKLPVISEYGNPKDCFIDFQRPFTAGKFRRFILRENL